MPGAAEQRQVTTARLTSQSPVLFVRDVPRSVAYWNDKVGFATGGLYGDPPGFAILRRDACHMMLSVAPAGHEIVPYWKISNQLWNAYFWVDDARALFAEMQERGATIDYEPTVQPYDVLEFGIRDLEGHDIGFGQVLDDDGPERPAAA